MVLGLRRLRTKLWCALPSSIRQSLQGRKLETLDGELPPLIHHSLEALLEEPESSLKLGTAYDIIWRYLIEQDRQHLQEHIQLEDGFHHIFKDESLLFNQFPSIKNLVDLLFEHFNLGYQPHARLGLVACCANSMAEKHYNTAIKTDPSAVLPRKRLALMWLSRGFIHYAITLLEEAYNPTGDTFAKNCFEQLSKYHDTVSSRAGRGYFLNITKRLREDPGTPVTKLQRIDDVIKDDEASQKTEEDAIVEKLRCLASTQRNPVLKAAGLTLAGVEEYVKKHLNEEEGYIELHNQYVLRSQLDIAFKVLEDAVKEHPEFLEARKVLAMDCYAWKGEWLKTIQELESLMVSLPDDLGVIIPLIHFYEELGMTQKTDELWKSFFNALIFADSANSCDISKICGTRNSVRHVGNWELEDFGFPLSIVVKFFPNPPGEDAKDRVVEYDMIETFRDIATKRPELGLLHSLPKVRYFSTESPVPRPGACLVTEMLGAGWTLESMGGDFFKKNILPSAVKLLAGIHAASSDFPEGKLTDVIAEDETHFENRLMSILFEAYNLLPPPEKAVVGSFISSYGPISSVLRSLPRCYYKDANLRNWLSSIGSESVATIDFESNHILPPQLDLVSLLEFGSAYLDDDEIDGMLQTYHSSFCEFSQQDIPLSDFMEAYPYAAVQRHLELIGYRKRDLSSSQDEKELRVLEKKIDYHKNRALHYLSCLAEKHTGANREDLLKLMELLPLFLPQFTVGQP